MRASARNGKYTSIYVLILAASLSIHTLGPRNLRSFFETVGDGWSGTGWQGGEGKTVVLELAEVITGAVLEQSVDRLPDVCADASPEVVVVDKNLRLCKPQAGPRGSRMLLLVEQMFASFLGSECPFADMASSH